jgi:hypothetical protein
MVGHARGELLVVAALVDPTQRQFSRQPVELAGIVAQQQLDDRELQLVVISRDRGRFQEMPPLLGA